jgi:hypothetical protein
MNKCEYGTDIVRENTTGHEAKPVPVDNHNTALDTLGSKLY